MAAGKNPRKESEAGEQLAFREKNLRDQPPLFGRDGLPIPHGVLVPKEATRSAWEVLSEPALAEEDELS
jgi:hypothetical protein